MKPVLAERGNVEFDNQHPNLGDSREELLLGLQQSQKMISPKFFYGGKGSELFDQITGLAEYYPSRTEMGILQRHCDEIAQYCTPGCILIEPGSGNSKKVRVLLDALRPDAYVPLDIAADFLHQSAIELGEEFPWLKIHAICADFGHQWKMAQSLPQGRRVVFYPGSTIGNMDPEMAVAQLLRLKELMGADGGVLIGVDLHKPEPILNAAYNDAAGVTADFNLNVLDNVNQLLDAEFDKRTFSHHAFYNTDRQRIEMHLVSEQIQTVRCHDQQISFERGESIHTENSYKYTVAKFTALAADAGLVVRQSWIDDEQLFSVHFLECS